MTNLVRKSGLTRAARLAERLDLETDKLSQEVSQLLMIQKDAGELKLLGKHDLMMIFNVKISALEEILACDDFPRGYFFRNKRRWFFRDIVRYIKGKTYTPEIRAKLAKQFGHEIGGKSGNGPAA